MYASAARGAPGAWAAQGAAGSWPRPWPQPSAPPLTPGPAAARLSGAQRKAILLGLSDAQVAQQQRDARGPPFYFENPHWDAHGKFWFDYPGGPTYSGVGPPGWLYGVRHDLTPEEEAEFQRRQWLAAQRTAAAAEEHAAAAQEAEAVRRWYAEAYAREAGPFHPGSVAAMWGVDGDWGVGRGGLTPAEWAARFDTDPDEVMWDWEQRRLVRRPAPPATVVYAAEPPSGVEREISGMSDGGAPPAPVARDKSVLLETGTDIAMEGVWGGPVRLGRAVSALGELPLPSDARASAVALEASLGTAARPAAAETAVDGAYLDEAASGVDVEAHGSAHGAGEAPPAPSTLVRQASAASARRRAERARVGGAASPGATRSPGAARSPGGVASPGTGGGGGGGGAASPPPPPLGGVLRQPSTGARQRVAMSWVGLPPESDSTRLTRVTSVDL